MVELACNLADIVSITGEKEGVARHLGGEFEKLGMQVEYQEVEEGRLNIIAAARYRRIEFTLTETEQKLADTEIDMVEAGWIRRKAAIASRFAT